MHPNRRRKKRPNYGIRTVEVARGPNGFGFTISGQQPCILSCIVAHSPADQSGLRAGDFLISVNGLSVSKSTHDSVVSLIGNSVGPIRMTIAENYYSDSSDEEVALELAHVRKPKYAQRARVHRPHLKSNEQKERRIQQQVASQFVVPTYSPPTQRIEQDMESCPIEYKALVGYLGTIEMPKQLLPNSRLQTVCSCIRKLRQEKRTPTLVLITVLPSCLTLKNSSNQILAIYPTNRVVYISSSSDKESRYFGLVTSAVNESPQEVEVYNSCHVFAIDPKLIEHRSHISQANLFRLTCTPDIVTGCCLEFPKSVLYVISLVQNMYKLEDDLRPRDDMFAHSPQPSASSNSDSGIGFRDDCGNISDRILVVEFPAHPSIANKRSGMDASSLSLKSESKNEVDINNIRAFDKTKEETKTNRLTVRAMPDPITIEEDCKSHESISIGDGKDSTDNISVHSQRSCDFHLFKTPTKLGWNRKGRKMVASAENLLEDDKLSPKVYGLSKPTTSFDHMDKYGYGSLQDLGSWTGMNANKCLLAQSEPDVRLQHRKNELCEDGTARGGEGPGAWATGLEKLLDDPVGLQAFAEFLKKEFSAENIYFWTACERFRRLSAGAERIEEACRIYQQHLCAGAPEPVNVDSQGRHCTEALLQEAGPDLFEQAQKQIFNLMKFDSYPRFLKSDLYKQCLSGKAPNGTPDSGLLLQPVTPITKLKKSLSNAEDRRRKSLLPWHRKNRSKSKDRTEKEEEEGDIHSSKSSLISQESSKVEDMVGKGPLCRVILSNGSTTVVQIRQNETIEQMVLRVLEKRGITYTSFEVSTDKHSKAWNISESSTVLTGCEVKIEQRVVFKLDLPNRKVIAVKSKYTKLIIDVLKPILNKYNYNLEQVIVSIGGKEEMIDINQPVTSIDGLRLNIQLFEEVKKAALKVPLANLDEITNKVFKDLLHEKTDADFKSSSDRASVKSEDWGSEHSSGIFGRFLRRDSGVHEKKKKTACVRTLRGSSAHNSTEDLSESAHGTSKKPLIAKWKSGVHKLHVGNHESDELYEGLKRAQRSRLEDQRGTEINFELPDFLKDRENAHSSNRLRKIRRRTETIETKSCDVESITQFHVARSNYENRNIDPLHIPSDSKFTGECSSSSTSPTKCNNIEDTIKCEPPPLPPKPKVFPIRPSNWGANHVFKVPRPPRSDSNSLYLEQPTSSFV